jgi:hypothetical protein
VTAFLWLAFHCEQEAIDVARHGSFGLARGAASEVAVALVLVMILAALIALIVVAVGLVIVQRRSDRRRAHLLANGDSIRRRSG